MRKFVLIFILTLLKKKDYKKLNVSNQFISLIYEENVLEVLLIFEILIHNACDKCVLQKLSMHYVC